MKKIGENNMSNMYLMNKRNIYCDKPYLNETEARMGLSHIIVSDCVKSIGVMAKVMNKEITEKLTGEAYGRKKRRVTIGQKHSKQRIG